MKYRLAPAAAAVRPDGDQFSVGWRHVPTDQHDAAIRQRGEHGLVRIPEVAFIRHGNVAGLPSLAMVIAIDGG